MIDCWRSGEAWRDTACKAEAQALVESLAQGSAGESEGVRTTKNKIEVLLISPFHICLFASATPSVFLVAPVDQLYLGD
jgi:hypothetical protein